MKHIYLIGASLLVLASCKPNLEPTKPTSGDANFTSYVAIGNSLTAGYADGTLYRSGQINSYPNMLAEMFAFAGGGEFKQPMPIPFCESIATIAEIFMYCFLNCYRCFNMRMCLIIF